MHFFTKNLKRISKTRANLPIFLFWISDLHFVYSKAISSDKLGCYFNCSKNKKKHVLLKYTVRKSYFTFNIYFCEISPVGNLLKVRYKWGIIKRNSESKYCLNLVILDLFDRIFAIGFGVKSGAFPRFGKCFGIGKGIWGNRQFKILFCCRVFEEAVGFAYWCFY